MTTKPSEIEAKAREIVGVNFRGYRNYKKYLEMCKAMAHWVLDRTAREGDSFAEEIKQTSHKDGLGMGDQRSEGVVREYRDRIRGLK